MFLSLTFNGIDLFRRFFIWPSVFRVCAGGFCFSNNIHTFRTGEAPHLLCRVFFLSKPLYLNICRVPEYFDIRINGLIVYLCNRAIYNHGWTSYVYISIYIQAGLYYGNDDGGLGYKQEKP